MVLNKKIWVAVGLIIVAFTSILVYARLHNEQSVTANTYQTWQKTFVTRQSDQATYVNAGADGKKMAMSEAQGLGMLITAQAGAKAGRVRRTSITCWPTTSKIGWLWLISKRT